MYIDPKRVLSKKKKTPDASIEKRFNAIGQNQSITTLIEFLQEIRKYPTDIIMENSQRLYGLNSSQALNLMEQVLVSHHIDADRLDAELYAQQAMLEYVSNSDKYSESYKERLTKLTETTSGLISYRESPEYLSIITKETFAIRRAQRCATMESYLADDLDVMINNINTNPEVIMEYEKMLRTLKLANPSAIMSSLPLLLSRNTDLVLAVKITSLGTGFELIRSLPKEITYKLIEANVKKSILNAYNRIFDQQIAKMYHALKTGENSKYTMCSQYLEALKDAKQYLNQHFKTITESSEILSEDEYMEKLKSKYFLYEEDVMEDIAAEIEDLLTDIVFEPETSEAFTEALSKLTSIRLTLESFEKVEEGKVSDALIKGAHKAEDASRKAASKIDSARSTAGRIVDPIKRITNPLVNLINKTINDIRDMDSRERRNRIITGQFKFKLLNALKIAIAGVASGKLVGVVLANGSPIGPIITLITLITSFAIDKNLDAKVRKDLLNELQGELKIVNEKIDDSRSDEDKEKKYQLMRIKQKLERDIERIRFKLK